MNENEKLLNLLDDEKQRLITYHPEDHKDLFIGREEYPSYRIYTTKYWKKAEKGLRRIEKEYNDSWYNVLKRRWAGKEEQEALFYRGTTFNGAWMFEQAERVAKALKLYGVQKGDEIGCCINNCPQLIPLLLGANKVGAVLNFFGSAYNPVYLKQILHDCDHKLFFATDDEYVNVKEIIDESEIENKVLLSLATYLPKNPEKSKTYEPQWDAWFRYEDKASAFAAENEDTLTFEQFLDKGDAYTGSTEEKCDLDTEFLITYTSGSTKIGFPKRMIHKNRGLITDGVFHDADLSSNPSVKGFRTISHFHTDTATTIISIISNALMQNWSLALEPELGRTIFLDILLLNKPNYVCAATNFYLEAAKQYLVDKRYHDENGKGRTLDFLLVTFAVGEACQPGEEYFINTFLKKAKAGHGVKVAGPIRLPYGPLGMAGGDTEHGGIFYIVMKKMVELQHPIKLRNKDYGMDPLPYVQSTVLKKQEDGSFTEVGYNEPGIIVANSPITMAGYRTYEKTKEKVITDDRGIDWVSCDVFGYIDEMGAIHMKDRRDNKVVLEDGTRVIPYEIVDVVEKDRANIMTCLLTKAEVDGKLHLILNFDFNPLSKKPKEEIVDDLNRRLKAAFPEIADRFLYRVYDLDHPFPITASGKRSLVAVEQLQAEGTKSFKKVVQN